MEWAVLIAIAFLILGGVAIRNALKNQRGSLADFYNRPKDADFYKRLIDVQRKEKKSELSIKDRVKVKKKFLEHEIQELEHEIQEIEDWEEERREEANRKETFSPVYEAFIEIEKEYGNDGVLEDNTIGEPVTYEIEVFEERCRIALKFGNKVASELEIYCDDGYGKKISVIGDGIYAFYEDPERIIEEIVDWIATFIEPRKP